MVSARFEKKGRRKMSSNTTTTAAWTTTSLASVTPETSYLFWLSLCYFVLSLVSLCQLARILYFK